jgi:drug/metabolite transporter (DMT)-like permease
MGATWTIYRPESLRWSRRALFIVCGLGLLSGASSLAYNWSLTWLDASMAVMIFAVNPVVALSYLWLGGERMTIRQIVRLLLALVGVYLLIGPGGEVNLWGVLLVVFAMLAWSAQMVGAQWWLRDRDPGAVSFYSTASSLWVVFGYWWVRGEEFHVPGLHSWLLIILLVVIATFVARFSFYGAIQKIGSGQMALLMPVETMLAVTWSMFFLGERLSWLQGIGAFFILTSAILAFKRLGRIRIPGRWKAIVPME